MGIECKYEDIKNHMDNICEFVRENCEYAYFNIYSLHYCKLDQNIWLTLPILLLIGLLCFFLLSDTSNRYLSNSLTLLSDKLKISQNLAGLTFVAFGNGAPDVISSIVASTDDTDGIEFTLGALMGASVFVTSFVLSTVIIYAKSVKVERHLFVRDILMYLFTIGILCAFSYERKISLWESILYLSIYVIYAIIAVIQDKYSFRAIQASEISEEIASQEEVIADDIAHRIEKQNENYEESNKIQESEASIKRSPNDSKLLRARKANSKMNLNASSITYTDMSLENIMRNDHFYQDRDSRLIGEDLNMSVSMNGGKLKRYGSMINVHLLSIKYRIKKHYFEHKETKWTQKNLANKIFYILIEFPFTLLRDITIPPVDISRWNRCFVIIMPITTFLFIVFMTSNYNLFLNNIYILISTIVVLVLISFLISRIAYYNKIPDCIMLFCILAFGMSVFWIWCISEMLVDLLKVTGVILNIPEAFLGMTILAFGNSIPDLSVNCSLAKNGFGEMAIAGSIAGPLFNVLVGLGISLVRKNIIRGDINFFFFDFGKNAIILISFVALTINLIRLLLHGVISKFNLNRVVSYLGYFVYLGFCVGIFFFTFR